MSVGIDIEFMVHIEFVYIASFSNWSNVLVTNTIPQVDKARRLSMHWKYYVSLHVISLSRSLSLSLFICVVSVYLYVYATCIHFHGVYVNHWKLYELCLQ